MKWAHNNAEGKVKPIYLLRSLGLLELSRKVRESPIFPAKR